MNKQRRCAVCGKSLKGKKVRDQYGERLICQECGSTHTFAPNGELVRGRWEFEPGTCYRVLVRQS
jgi:hypothetical protein